MKKTLAIITIIVAIMTSANAQEAFKHLGFGIEIGTTGAGVEFALPVVSDHLVLKAGYNFPSVPLNTNFNFSTNNLNSEVDKANAELEKIPGCTERLKSFSNPATLTADLKANFQNAKIMLEYYPSKKSNFHIVAGIFIGNGEFVSGQVVADKLMSEFNSIKATAKNLKEKYPTADIPSFGTPTFNLDGKTYTVADGKAILSANIAKVKPYVGLGFGRSIPRTRIGFQGEFGAWYHGTLNITTPNSPTTYDSKAPELLSDEIKDLTGKIVVYPSITLRLTVRLF